MPGDTTRRGPADSSRVNVHEPYELRYWTEKFQCSAEQLKAAVTAAGTNVAAVQARLRHSKITH
ncbi:DUF3606 domain-containing protein [Polaromonas sp. A23]|uniref:DUF3606 domain-containing protein n=1 Tax=Polaromonas sp. A23 TaxID=1944133 RepID=UPI0009865775|nr:DUF3606 domain-containing protein [Polaromonas sp. A23]OOG37226.1 hypothetical protein B0B52_18930 [Polaromonas sp. A23]